MMHLNTNMRLLQQFNHTSEEAMKCTLPAQQFAIWLLEVGEGKRNQENKIILLPSIIPLYTNY